MYILQAPPHHHPLHPSHTTPPFDFRVAGENSIWVLPQPYWFTLISDIEDRSKWGGGTGGANTENKQVS